ncbi:succinylglutamate desuccinylase/aspartoacylase family protein [Paraburkholderia sp. RP-4-7]|uniref:Succinylglutamate desuccinylase/aspartoacylase family protein n=1 Tax=Paraburkholderia polaris TaxID=2728848 RepID=A0A848IRJ6_9BURK|nr:succinylglutamate desuccinylase/aspartoacylase family protein [Paraburkholderia polaris]NMM03666.1 succinylglutamate desuccinylase/aspartoacylase family protein [Paraburkholderia polaris]
MKKQQHPLVSPTTGTTRSVTSFHYGTRGRLKAYVHASLHADELPGMLVSTVLQRKLSQLEENGRLNGEIVIVPVANPIGLNQVVFGQRVGRFEVNSGQNFNRNFYDFSTALSPELERSLSDNVELNHCVIHRAMHSALNAQSASTELSSLRLVLQRLSYDADVVLDLHCDRDAVVHLYTSPDLWSDVEPLARYIGAKASLLAVDSGGQPFDEVYVAFWRKLHEQYGGRFPIPVGPLAATIELRGQRDVSYDLAEQDAQAIIDFLMFKKLIDGEPSVMPALEYPPTPLAGAAPILAPATGLLVFRVPVGSWVNAYDQVADIIDPLSDLIVTVKATVAGVLYARETAIFAISGMEVARIASAESFRTGPLLLA